MQDRYGRTIEYLRLSVTDSCNLNCMYCTPGSGGHGDADCMRMSPDEMGRVVGILAGLGIRKVRITGGEPLLREDICDIVEKIAARPEIRDISLTTNAIRLGPLAGKLKASGLRRVNISLDSLNPERFTRMTGGGNLEDTLEGVLRALEAGLTPVKINTVLIKGINDEEVDDFIRLTGRYPLDVRFIELMPVGRFGEMNRDRIVPNDSIIAARPFLIPCGDDEPGQPARYYRIEGHPGWVGFISPVSHKFCHCCNRIRLTCDGKIRPCLGNNGEADILEVLRHRPEDLGNLIFDIIFDKPAGHDFQNGFSSTRGMGAIGG